ncbi:MAG: type III-A CRISPR-associated RAMP protein Csm4 [Bacteroidota bacterium]
MQKTYHIVKLHFSSPILFSKGIFDYTKTTFNLYSDTLKSALFVENLNLLNAIQDPLEFFGKFKISSAFPFYGAHLFFPRPYKNLLIQFTENAHIAEESKIRKKRKKIQWLEKSIFEKEINNQPSQIPLHQLSSDNLFVFNTDSVPPYIIKEEILSRVRYHVLEDNEPFDVIRYHFHERAGLFTLIECDDTHFLNNYLYPAFELLGINGIGGYKTIGHGTFTPQFSSLTLNLPEQSSHLINLSLFLPQKQELESIFNTSLPLYYSLIKRTGYIASTPEFRLKNYRKNAVYMFQNASVFPAQELKGTIVDLTPPHLNTPHPIYRDGTAIFLPIII